MASPDCEVLVIGGGAAGLNAARLLAAAGRDVLVVEARHRLGGRVHSFSDPLVSIPIELGAEFIHGHPEATFDLLDRFRLVACAGAEGQWRHHQGRLCKLEEFEDSMQPVTELLRGHFQDVGTPDMTLEAFLRDIAGPRAEQAADPGRWHASIAMARSFFEGFDAADPLDASARALAEELAGIGNVGQETQWRLREGYGGLIAALAAECRTAGARLQIGTRVRSLAWSQGRVDARLDGGIVSARQAVITLPVGLLQEESCFGFDPELPAKRDAARRLGTGPVVKIVLGFREIFWERSEFATRAAAGECQDLADLAMWHMPGSAWPTWWTYHPLRAPVLSGWAAGPAARALSGRSEVELVDSALQALAASLNATTAELGRLLEVAHLHDWPADDLARGAYSYLTVGSEGAREALGKPIDQTLFFAGEATDTDGQASTVGGALASGARAATEVLKG